MYANMADDMNRTSSTKCKKKHFKPKHQKSKLFRANEPLLSVFMWGVNHTVNELNHVNIPVMLMPDDFRAFTKIRVDNHLYQKDIMPSHYKVKEYCPLVFRNLRERFSIYDSDYLKSLTKFQPVANGVLSGKPTKFYSTYDNQLILKTLSSDEVENMHHLLKEYHPYIVERYGKTLLPQYLGMYRLTVEGQVTYIVVMRNIFNSRLPIHKKYDLKGSNPENREASEKERGKDLPCFKDNDFIKDGAKLHLDLESKNKLISTLEADTAFLAKENLIDYSLCLGIHDCTKYQQDMVDVNSPKSTSSNEDDEEVAGDSGSPKDGALLGESMQVDQAEIGVISSTPLQAGGRQIYFMGLVDVLTQFGLRKRIVTIDPEQYRKKFMEFIVRAIVTQP
uniref:1-phosphatidylinositol-5-phosphate 4-kinase n=1 Tax=Aceria tosichella TaxID=561515 RepID=A0A6G1SGC5_9ACAR